MSVEILLFSNKDKDIKIFNKILEPDRFTITLTRQTEGIEDEILKNNAPLILADYDFISDKAKIFYDIQKGRSKACLIFYGDDIGAEEVPQILQKGVYTFIPRRLIAERIYDAILGGLENRKAFIEILGMIDELKGVNKKLEEEKDALKKRNRELSFINILSREISYDLNWDRILARMIESGMEKSLDYSLFGILYSIGSNWNLAVHLSESPTPPDKDSFKYEILGHLSSHYEHKIPREEVNLHLISSEDYNVPESYKFSELYILPLSLAGHRLGSVFIIPKEPGRNENNGKILMNTLANILSLSLKNAQEYHKLREAAVTDNLTGVYNRKGLFDFLEREVPRAKRYGKAMSFILTDMDEFKRINDSMGHQAGDYVLRELAGMLKESLRQPDIVARYGGDEFAILLPETSTDEAERIMSRISNKITEHIFKWGSGEIKTRMSYGISNTDELFEEETEESLVRLADSRLYKAKEP